MARQKRSYHHGDLRAALIASGLVELEATGVAGLSLRAVARRAGVSQTAPAHHFGNKDGLLAALATEGFTTITAMQSIVLGRGLPPAEQLEQLALLYHEAARSRPNLFQLMVGGALPERERFDALTEATARSQSLLRTAIAQVAAATGSTVSIEVAMAAMWSLSHGLGVLVLDGLLVPGTAGLPDHRELVTQMVALVIDGLRPQATDSSASRSR